MALPKEPGRIPGDTVQVDAERAVQVDASWLSAHEAARRANPVRRVPAVRTPMPVPRELYPTPTYTPIEVEPLRQWVPSEPERRPAIRAWFSSLLRLSKPPARKAIAPPADEDLPSTAVVVESRELPPILTSEQQQYLQRIRAEEREIADERRRESWARLLTRYNGSQRHDEGDRSGGVAAAPAPDPATESIQSEIAAEVTHWQDRSARLSSELNRADAERLAGVLKLAESEAYAEEAQRTTQAEREERRLATEREATALAARVEAEARAEEERLATLALTRANVEVA